MFLNPFLFTSICVFWCFYFCIFFVFHFYFKFSFPGGRWQVCISVSFTFCRAFFLPWFNKFTFSSWLVRLFIVDCFSLSPNACVKILVSVFDIFRSFFEYKSTNCLCEPRLHKYVLLMYSATVAQRSVLTSLFCSEKYFGMTVNFLFCLLTKV